MILVNLNLVSSKQNLQLLLAIMGTSSCVYSSSFCYLSTNNGQQWTYSICITGALFLLFLKVNNENSNCSTISATCQMVLCLMPLYGGNDILKIDIKISANFQANILCILNTR